MTLEPEDNEPLLREAAHSWLAPAKDGGGPPNLGAVTRALLTARVLVVGDTDGPRALPGDPEPMLVAFTDDEAAAAWAAGRVAGEAGRGGVVDVGVADSLDAGRERWLRWLASTGAEAVIVNPAGPNFCLTSRRWVQTARPSRLPGRRRPGGGRSGRDGAWLDLAARAAERRRVPGVLEEVATAIDEERQISREAILHELNAPQLNALRSGLWVAEIELLRARLDDRFGRTRERDLRLARAATAFALAGEPARGAEIGRPPR